LVLVFLPLPVLDIWREVAHPTFAAGFTSAAFNEDSNSIPSNIRCVAANERPWRRGHALVITDSVIGAVAVLVAGANFLNGLDQDSVLSFVPATLLQVGAQDFVPAVAALVGVTLDAKGREVATDIGPPTFTNFPDSDFK
jgi:hypothetical protein